MGGLLAARNKKSMILEFGKSTNCSVHWESCRNASSDSNRSVTNWKNPSAKYSQKYIQTDWKSIPMFLSEFQSLQLLLLGRLFSGFYTKDYSKIDYCKLKLIIGPKRNTQTGFFNLSFFGSMGMAMLSLFDIPWWWSNSRSAVTRVSQVGSLESVDLLSLHFDPHLKTMKNLLEKTRW